MTPEQKILAYVAKNGRILATEAAKLLECHVTIARRKLAAMADYGPLDATRAVINTKSTIIYTEAEEPYAVNKAEVMRGMMITKAWVPGELRL